MDFVRHRLSHLWCCFLLVGLGSCGDVFGTDGEEFLAVIDLGDFPHKIELPSEVERGEEFEVRIQTFPTKTCEERGPTEVDVKGMRAVIIPFDRVVEGKNCPGTAQFDVFHIASLEFERRGTATVFVRGVRLHNPGDGLVVDTIIVERTVEVR